MEEALNNIICEAVCITFSKLHCFVQEEVEFPSQDSQGSLNPSQNTTTSSWSQPSLHKMRDMSDMLPTHQESKGT